jgi:hypothetical protein
MTDNAHLSELDFEHHRRRYAALTSGQNAEEVVYFNRQAQQLHSLVVQDSLDNIYATAAALGSVLTNKDAIYFLRHGVGRRLGLLRTSYRSLVATIHPDRSTPLSLDDVGLITRDLNVIYINLVGTMDNYAWCLLNEKDPSQSKQINPMKVGLFSAALSKDVNLSILVPIQSDFDEWHRDLKTRRDPSAHRIPLAVPPAMLTLKEHAEYAALESQIGAAAQAKDFDRAEQLRVQQERLGTLLPHFGKLGRELQRLHLFL